MTKIWDGRSSTLENEQHLGVKEYARRMANKGPDVLAITDITPSGERLTHYAEVYPGEDMGGDPDRWYVNGICAGNNEGFATKADAARYINKTWPNMPIKGI